MRYSGNPFGKVGLFFVGLLILAYFLVIVFQNPAETEVLPCPLYAISDIQCPGCGSQRALYHLFHLELKSAFHYNALLLILLPYLTLGLLLEYANPHQNLEKLKQILYGRKAAFALLFLIGAWMLMRNLI